MLMFQKNKLIMNGVEYIYCLMCLRDITKEVKVEIHKETYCPKCASKIYEDEF